MQSYAVAKPKIAEVINLYTGMPVSADIAIGSDYDKVAQAHVILRELNITGKPLYACVHCAKPVVLNCMHTERRFYFRHASDIGECTVDTRNARTPAQIDALRYDGAKESFRHLQMKAWIAQCLALDGEFSEIETEATWRSTKSGRYRRPDVRATYRGMPIAFEVQLSSTYAQVIAERRQFYLQEGGLLFWVFAEFDEGMKKLTQDGIFFNNNQNAFLVNAETVEASIKAGTFKLECVWRVPTSPTEVSDLQSELRPFSELTLDQPRQMAYHYDFYGAREELERQAAAAYEAHAIQQERESWRRNEESFRRAFEDLWVPWFRDENEDREVWDELVEEAELLGYRLPSSPRYLPYVQIGIIFSMLRGPTLIWNYKFIQVAHLALPGPDRTQVMPYLGYVWKAMERYHRVEIIKDEDTTGKWDAKVQAHREAARSRVLTAPEEPEVARFIEFLFPGLARKADASKPPKDV